ncbi:hypothetical protein STRDD11_00572 [Streptococcus sp. DD11]|uniref:hypothetical protein n=1 Tax=Streptococcus sp. DD11 TaxID=1777879 RepID=UPI000793E4BE|nr:hypothetical protein [Streptococcus sp. DD11]KXT85040.1 hypothetical protein STRDD11_00572 [Streptococcus sp. DD11]
MSKRNKSFRILIFLSLISFSVFAIWYLYQKNAKEFQEKYGQFTYYSPEYEPVYSFLENDKAIAYNWKVVNSEEQENMKKAKSYIDPEYNVIREFDSGYFVNSYMKLKANPNLLNKGEFNRNIPQKGEYWKLAVYKFQNKKLKKREFDVFEMVRNYDSDLIPIKIRSHIIADSNAQKYYAVIYLRKKSTDKEKAYCIDLDEGRIVSDKGINPYRDLPNNFTTSTNFAERMKKRGVALHLTWMSLESSYSEKQFENSLLSSKYPQVYKIMHEKDACIAFLNKETDVELVKNVTELFFPPGTNVFENVTIPAQYSVDGQEHVINSAEELQKYYKEGE